MSHQEEGRCPQRSILSRHLEPSPGTSAHTQPAPPEPPVPAGQSRCCWRAKAEKWRTGLPVPPLDFPLLPLLLGQGAVGKAGYWGASELRLRVTCLEPEV